MSTSIMKMAIIIFTIITIDQLMLIMINYFKSNLIEHKLLLLFIKSIKTKLRSITVIKIDLISSTTIIIVAIIKAIRTKFKLIMATIILITFIIILAKVIIRLIIAKVKLIEVKAVLIAKFILLINSIVIYQ